MKMKKSQSEAQVQLSPQQESDGEQQSRRSALSSSEAEDEDTSWVRSKPAVGRGHRRTACWFIGVLSSLHSETSPREGKSAEFRPRREDLVR